MHVTLLTVPDGGRTSDFQLSFLLDSNYRVLFCSQGMQTSRSGDQSFVLWVGTIRSDLVTRTVVQACDAGKALDKRDLIIWVSTEAQGEVSSLTGRAFWVGDDGEGDPKSDAAR